MRWFRLAVAAAVGLLATAGVASAQTTYTWNPPTGTGAGNWDTTTATWLAGGSQVAYVSGPNTAVFGDRLTVTASTVTLQAALQASSVQFLNTGSLLYSLGAGGTNGLTLNAGGAADATVVVGRGVVGAGSYSAGTGHAFTGNALTFVNNLVVTNNGAFGTTALSASAPVSGSGAAGVAVGGQGNTVLSGVVGGFTGGVTKTGPGTLNLSGANTFGGTGAVLAITGGVLAAPDGALGNAANAVSIGAGATFRSPGTTTYPSTRAFTVTGTPASPSGFDLGSSVTATFNGTLAGAAGTALQVSLTGGAAAGTLSVEAAQPFAGAVTVGTPGLQVVGSVVSQRIFSTATGATLRLQNAGTLAASGVTLSNGAGLTVVQSTPAVTSRLTAPLTSHSGRFLYTQSANGGTAVADTFGPLTVTGVHTFTGSGTAGPAAGTTLNFGNLVRTDNAMLLFRAPQSGTQGTFGGSAGAATSVRVFFANLTPDLVSSGTTRSVVGWAGNPTATTSTDTQNLMTYDGNGFRPLNTTTEVTATFNTPGANIRVAGGASTVPTGGLAINSLSSTSTGSVTAAAATDVLTIASGGLSTFNTFTFNNVTLAFPNGAYFHSGFPFVVAGTSQVTGSGGVAVGSLGASSSYQLRFTNTQPNTFTGGLYAQGNAGVTFTDNAQLGRDGGGLNAGEVVLGGGQLVYNPAAAATASLNDGATNRPIRVNESNGTIGTGLAAAVLQIPGVISGPGQVQFGGGGTSSGTGVVSLTGGANSYSGGTVVSTGILRISSPNQLGTGPLYLNGGTLQAAGNLNFSAAPTATAGSILDTQANTVTLAGGLNGSGGTLGITAAGIPLQKAGAGTLLVTGAGNFASGLTIQANGGTITLSGAGALPELGTVTVQRAGTFNVDDSTGGPLARTGRTTTLSLNNGGAAGAAPVVNLTAQAGGGSRFTFGGLEVVGGTGGFPNASIVNLFDGGSGGNVVSLFSLTTLVTNNTLTFAGTANFGIDSGPAATGTRVFFATAPNLTGVTFTGFGGTGPATYDSTYGLTLLQTSSGTFIDNIQNVGPGSVTPSATSFTTTGATTANLGAAVKSLTVAGHTVTLVPNVRGPQAGNLNAPADTLVLTAGTLSSSAAGSLVTAGSAVKLQFGANAGINVNTFDLTVGPNVTLVGTAGLTKSGTGGLTINGPNQLGGVYTLTAGGVTLNTGGTVAGLSGTASAATLTLGAGQSLALTGAASSSYLGVLAGPVGTAVSLPAGFTGTQTLTAVGGTPNAFRGAYTVAGGTLAVGGTGALGTDTATNTPSGVTVTAGGTLAFSNSGTVPALAAVPVSVAGAGAVGRTGALESLTGTSAFAGPVTLAGATTLAASGGTLSLGGGVSGANVNLTVALTNGGALNLNPAATAPLNLGTGTLTVSGGVGGGAFTLPNQANTLGNATVSGTGGSQTSLTVFADNNLGATSNTLTLDAGTLRFGAVFSLDSARAVVVTPGGAGIDTNGFSPTIGAVPPTTGSLTKFGTGTLTLGAAAGHTGGTTVVGGTLALGVPNALPAAGALTLGNVVASDANGSLTLGGNSLTVASLTLVAPSTTTTRVSGAGTLTVNGPITYVNNAVDPNNDFPVVLGTSGSTVLDLGGGVRTISVIANANTNDMQIPAVIQNGGITYAGSSANASAAGLQLSGANTFAGGLTVTSGVLNVSATGTLGASTNALTVTAGGVAGVGTNSTVNTSSAQTVGSLSGGTLSGTAVARLSLGGDLTVNQSAATTFAGVVGGTGGLAKQGTGTLTLAGANTYTGPTTVGGGTLRVNGSTAAGGAVAVAAGATLGGTGTIGGVTTFAGGSVLAPGASVGTLTATANVTVTGAPNPGPTVWQVELNGIGSGGGNTLAAPDTANVDRLNVTGAATLLNFATSGTDRIRIDLSQLGGAFDGTGDRVYYAIASVASAANLQSNGGTFDPAGFDYGPFAAAVTGTLQIEQSGTNLVLSFQPVPEPAAVLAVAAIGLAGLRAVRRRRAV